MKFVTTLLMLAMLVAFGFSSALLAETTSAVQESQVSPVYEQMMTEFYMLVGDYYDVSYDEVADVLATGISDDELAAAFYIAVKGEATAVEIASRRVAGEDWYKLYQSQGLYANDFWIPLRGTEDQRTFGRLVNLIKGKWNAKLILKNQEVVNLVNIGFMRTLYPKQSEQLSSLRADGLEFAYILHRNMRTAAYEHEIQLASEDN